MIGGRGDIRGRVREESSCPGEFGGKLAELGRQPGGGGKSVLVACKGIYGSSFGGAIEHREGRESNAELQRLSRREGVSGEGD